MKWYLLWAVVLLAGIILVVGMPRCSGGQRATARIVPPSFDATRAWNDLTHQVEAGYRIPGTPEHRKVKEWLVDTLGATGATVTTQQFSHKFGGKEITMWDIIADIPGTGKSAKPPVLLAAHWDSRPTADKDPDPAQRKQPIAGANDGASGVAILLEIARQLHATPIARDVQIVLFDGEDYGPEIDDMLLGSKYYAANLTKAKPAWGILLDMVGDKDLTIYREPNSDLMAKEVNNRVFHAAYELGYLVDKGAGQGFIDEWYKYQIEDDHMPLNRAGVPMADLIDFDYKPWHTRQDTPDQCSAKSLEMVGKTVLYVLRQEP